jgi:hypothetical protein
MRSSRTPNRFETSLVRKQRPDAALDPAGGVSDAATDAMERVRSTYDAVAERYADAMVNELHERPIERGLLDAILLEVKTRTRDGGRGRRGGPIVDVGAEVAGASSMPNECCGKDCAARVVAATES